MQPVKHLQEMTVQWTDEQISSAEIETDHIQVAKSRVSRMTKEDGNSIIFYTDLLCFIF